MPDRRVWIAQCLCGPNRHAIAALAGEAEDDVDAAAFLLPKLRAGVAELLQSSINPWCGICGAEQASWRYEVGRTGFRTLAEAAPHLAAAEAANRAVAALFGTHGPTQETDDG